MTRRSQASSAAAAGIVLAFLLAAVALEVARDRAYGEPEPARAVLYVRSGEAVRRMALSYSAVAADIYWIRALQYYGGTRLSKAGTKDYSLLYPLLDITTSLDPLFNIAYRFGAIFLAERLPGGAGRPDLAVALLQKGVRNRPGNWRYLQDIGMVYYWWLGDYREASVWFTKSAETPGAPWWMKSMAAVTAAQGGDRASSRLLWQSLLSNAENDWIRNNARLRLQQLNALDHIDQLQAVVRLFASRTGRLPSSFAVLARSGYLRGLPLDPAGAPYVLDPETGAVNVSPSSPLSPLPTGQQSMTAETR